MYSVKISYFCRLSAATLANDTRIQEESSLPVRELTARPQTLPALLIAVTSNWNSSRIRVSLASCSVMMIRRKSQREVILESRMLMTVVVDNSEYRHRPTDRRRWPPLTGLRIIPNVFARHPPSSNEMCVCVCVCCHHQEVLWLRLSVCLFTARYSQQLRTRHVKCRPSMTSWQYDKIADSKQICCVPFVTQR